MTDYSKMSDYEISCEVGRAISLADYLLARNEQKNYCNSWADAGPIAEEFKISIGFHNDGWVGYSRHHLSPLHAKQIWEQSKPCRAICIVFLMMNEGE